MLMECVDSKRVLHWVPSNSNALDICSFPALLMVLCVTREC